MSPVLGPDCHTLPHAPFPPAGHRRTALRELAGAFPSRTAALAVLTLLSGALPAVFAAGILHAELFALQGQRLSLAGPD